MANHIQISAEAQQSVSNLSRKWISNYYQSPNSIGNIVTQSFEDLMANGYGDVGATILNSFFNFDQPLTLSLLNVSGVVLRQGQQGEHKRILHGAGQFGGKPHKPIGRHTGRGNGYRTLRQLPYERTAPYAEFKNGKRQRKDRREQRHYNDV